MFLKGKRMRCSKCILPDTIPGITFNEKMECNYCQTNYPSYTPKGDDQLEHLLQKNLRNGSEADCLVGLSGGKDSTYSLIMLKEEFNMRVEAFTYMHEGSTDFSIENAKTTCEKLGIKHHIVSLSDQKHLKTFTGFFKSWLRSPSAVTAGMTCVACKHLHLLGSDLASRRNIPMIVWSNCPLEYSPFLALKIDGSKDNQLKRESSLKGSFLLAREMLKTMEFPKTFLTHFSTCFNGCLAAFPTSSYLNLKFPSVKPVFFYDYHDWNQSKIKNYIKLKVNWQVPMDEDDWHTDCLFNFFKEYMFLSEIGASYSDAFLSNQIRYGIITREDALIQLKEIRYFNYTGILETTERLGLEHLISQIDREIFNPDHI